MAWLAICQRCGFQYRNDQIRREWTGLRVCHGGGTNGCWEPRNAQDFVKGVPDKQSPPWVSPEPEDVFLAPGDVSADDL